MTGFYLANSRGSFLSLLAVFFFFFITKLKNKKGIILGIILSLILLAVAMPSRMEQIDDSQKSARLRISAWCESLEMVRYHNPFFGVGKGQFEKYSGRAAHNAFLQQLGETGLIGAFFWAGLIYATFKGLLKVLREKTLDPFKQSLYSAYLIGLIGFFVGLAFISADNEFLYIWLALCTSIMCIEELEMKFTVRDLKFIGGIGIASLIFAYITINLFKSLYT